MNYETTIQSIDQLRVFTITDNLGSINTIEDLLVLDITFLGLNQKDWYYSKGKRLKRDYMCVMDDTLVAIRDIYEYTYQGSTLMSFKRTLEYLGDDGTVAITKTIKETSDLFYLTKLEKTFKQNILGDLRSRGKELTDKSSSVPEPYKSFYLSIANSTDSILNHYHSLIQDYCLDFTWQPLIDQLQLDSTDDTHIMYSNLNTPSNADGSRTVINEILDEIT